MYFSFSSFLNLGSKAVSHNRHIIQKPKQNKNNNYRHDTWQQAVAEETAMTPRDSEGLHKTRIPQIESKWHPEHY